MLRKAFLTALALQALSLMSQTGPAGVGTSLNNVLWLKADAGPSSTLSSTPITLWADQSGNGIHVTQTLSAQQPSFVANVMNGFPAILFDNVSTANQNDKLLGPDSPLLDNTNGYTFFTATRPQNLDGNARAIVSKRTGVSIDQSFMLFYYTSNKLNIDIQTTNDRFASNLTYTSNNNYLSTLVYDGTQAFSGRCSLLDAENPDRTASETSTLVPDNSSPLLIGTTDAADPRPYGGYISEIIIYREALNPASRIIVNNYLSAKYNIPLLLNDKYSGDSPANGDYDREVAGIGREASGSNPSFSASVTGGLTMSANSGLDVGDYLFAGHAFPTNTTITSDVGGMTGTGRARWQRVWYVDITNTATPINVNIEFDMSDGGMGTFTLGPLSNYVLLYRAGQSGNWLEVASASAISGDRILFNSQNLSNNGYFTLGTRNFNNSPLPVELIGFTAKSAGTVVNLEWSTASEKNNLLFTLERARAGTDFEAFGTVKGAGNSNRLCHYAHSDEMPYNGISYYRLKQTDTDMRSSYSPIVSVNLLSEAEQLLVFPNPAESRLYLRLNMEQAGELLISCTDLSGREMFSGLRAKKNDTGLYSIDLPGLQPGVYSLIIRAGTREYCRKLIMK